MKKFYKLPTGHNVDFKIEMIKFCLWQEINHTKTNKNDTVAISIDYIMEKCGYSLTNRNKHSFSSYVHKALKTLIEDGQIVQIYGCSVERASGIAYLKFEILDRFYDVPTTSFAKITTSEFDAIMKIEDTVSKPTLLKVYAYIRSQIIETAKLPYGFCYGVDTTIVKDLELNRKTVDKCLFKFAERGVFVKHCTGSYCKNALPRNAPNIYVLPDENADSNIRALIEKLKKRYDVDEFAPIYKPVNN